MTETDLLPNRMFVTCKACGTTFGLLDLPCDIPTLERTVNEAACPGCERGAKDMRMATPEEINGLLGVT